MKTVKINIYQFNELSEVAKQNAINEFSNINTDFNWWEFTYMDAENIGLKITSFDLDRNRSANGHFILSACEVAQNIINEHGASCETFKTANNFLENWQPIFNDYLDENSENYENKSLEDVLLDLENDFLNSLLEDYSIMLQNEYEFLQSDKAIEETIISNEYEFLIDGTKY